MNDRLELKSNAAGPYLVFDIRELKHHIPASTLKVIAATARYIDTLHSLPSNYYVIKEQQPYTCQIVNAIEEHLQDWVAAELSKTMSPEELCKHCILNTASVARCIINMQCEDGNDDISDYIDVQAYYDSIYGSGASNNMDTFINWMIEMLDKYEPVTNPSMPDLSKACNTSPNCALLNSGGLISSNSTIAESIRVNSATVEDTIKKNIEDNCKRYIDGRELL